MNIFMTGSSELTEYDKQEISEYLKRYVNENTNHKIHLMCYRSLENEVMKYFIENDDFADRLHLYTFQPYTMLPSYLKKPIQFLREKGSKYFSFERQDLQIRRTLYENTWRDMIRNNNIDLVMCFYNKDKSTALIPVDISKEIGIDAMIYDLPAFNEDKLYQSIETKVRVV